MTNPAQPQPLAAGTLIADTYRLTSILGRGGMGVVWQADHVRLPGKRVAIKVLNGDIAQDPESLARFRREATIASRLNHPNIVQVHDHNTLSDSRPYLVLELLEGESLDRRVANGPMPLVDVQRILWQVCLALRRAHREHVVHRDLKPQNIFLCRRDHGDAAEVAKVLDFGISKIRGSTTVKTQTSAVLGTPQYMSPEQALGKHDEVDERTDIFCLGIMAYEMLAGEPPFSGQTIPEVVFKIVYEPPVPLDEKVPGLPPEVLDAVDTALEKDQASRFPTVAEFIEAFAGKAMTTSTDALVPSPSQAGDSMGFANTIVSTGGRSRDRDPAMAETVDSQNLRNRVGLNVATLDPSATAVDVTTMPRHESASTGNKRRWLLVAVPVLLAGLAVAYVGARDSNTTPAKADRSKRRSTAKADDAPTRAESPGQRERDSAASLSKDVDAGATASDERANSSDAGSVTAHADSPAAGAGRSTSVSAQPHAAQLSSADETDETDDPEGSPPPADPDAAQPQLSRIARRQLALAKRSFRQGNFARAERDADRAIRAGAGDYGRAIIVMSSCSRRRMSRAKSFYRQMNNGRLRHRVLKYCTDEGIAVD